MQAVAACACFGKRGFDHAKIRGFQTQHDVEHIQIGIVSTRSALVDDGARLIALYGNGGSGGGIAQAHAGFRHDEVHALVFAAPKHPTATGFLLHIREQAHQILTFQGQGRLNHHTVCRHNIPLLSGL